MQVMEREQKKLTTNKNLALPAPNESKTVPGVKIFATDPTIYQKNQKKISAIPWIVVIILALIFSTFIFWYRNNSQTKTNPNPTELVSTATDKTDINNIQIPDKTNNKSTNQVENKQTFDTTLAVDSITLNSRIYYLVGNCSNSPKQSDKDILAKSCGVWIIDRLTNNQKLLVPNLWNLDIINENLGSIQSFRLAAVQNDLEISLIVSSNTSKYGLLTLTVDENSEQPAFTKIKKLYEIKPGNSDWTTYYR